ncbi:hypothetical protein C8R44DRAFT_856228, partial [Mycena epipterygia]
MTVITGAGRRVRRGEAQARTPSLRVAGARCLVIQVMRDACTDSVAEDPHLLLIEGVYSNLAGKRRPFDSGPAHRDSVLPSEISARWRTFAWISPWIAMHRLDASFLRSIDVLEVRGVTYRMIPIILRVRMRVLTRGLVHPFCPGESGLSRRAKTQKRWIHAEGGAADSVVSVVVVVESPAPPNSFSRSMIAAPERTPLPNVFREVRSPSIQFQFALVYGIDVLEQLVDLAVREIGEGAAKLLLSFGSARALFVPLFPPNEKADQHLTLTNPGKLRAPMPDSPPSLIEMVVTSVLGDQQALRKMCGSRPRRCTSQSLTPLDVSAPHLILVSYAVPLNQESQAWTQRTPPKLLCPLLLSSLSTHNPATFLPLSRDLDFPCVKTDEEAMLNPGSDLHFNRSAWLVEHFKIAGCNFLKCFRVVQCTTAPPDFRTFNSPVSRRSFTDSAPSTSSGIAGRLCLVCIGTCVKCCEGIMSGDQLSTRSPDTGAFTPVHTAAA